MLVLIAVTAAIAPSILRCRRATCGDGEPRHRGFAVPTPTVTVAREHVRIVLALDAAAEVDVRIVDFYGRRVRTLASDVVLPPGEHDWRWDGRTGAGRRRPPVPIGSS